MNKKIRSLVISGLMITQLTSPMLQVFADEVNSNNGNISTSSIEKSSIVNIPDKNLKKALNEILNQSATANITQQQLSKIDGYLNLPGRNIENIEGLQYCTNINTLNLRGNKITNIKPLAKLINLDSLDLNENKIENISPLSKLINLMYLNLGKNKIEDISPLSGLKNLERLYLFYNNIKDVSPLAGLGNLEVLYLSENKISTINGLSNLNNLYELYLDRNELRDVSKLAELKKLDTLDLSNNKMTNISSLSKLKKLYGLSLSRNKIKDISPLAELKNLGILFLYENEITNIAPLAKLNNLSQVYLNKNRISDISPLSKLTNLQYYEIESQKISLNKLTVSSGANLKVKNTIKDEKGNIVPVTVNSSNGTYNSSLKQIELKNIKSDSTISWKFSKNVKINGRTGKFSGTVSQPVEMNRIPTVKATSASYNSNKISWNKISGANGYEVYRSTSKNGKYISQKTVTKGNTTNYIDSKLTTGKTYYYKVRSYKIVNGKKVYSGYSKVVSAKPTLSTPSINLSTSLRKSTVKWKKVSGASGYEIFSSTNKNKNYIKVGTVKSSATSYTHNKLPSKKTYYYKVRAYTKVGKNKVYSNYSTVKSIKIK